jgi:hypothetical protein
LGNCQLSPFIHDPLYDCNAAATGVVDDEAECCNDSIDSSSALQQQQQMLLGQQSQQPVPPTSVCGSGGQQQILPGLTSTTAATTMAALSTSSAQQPQGQPQPGPSGLSPPGVTGGFMIAHIVFSAYSIETQEHPFSNRDIQMLNLDFAYPQLSDFG